MGTVGRVFGAETITSAITITAVEAMIIAEGIEDAAIFALRDRLIGLGGRIGQVPATASVLVSTSRSMSSPRWRAIWRGKFTLF